MEIPSVKIWRLADPLDYRYARADRLGSWSEGTLCGECGVTSQRRIPPLVIEWEPGKRPVGDFTFTGFGSDIVITQRVIDRLAGVGGFETGPVEVAVKRKAPRRRPNVTRKREPPEANVLPTLFEIWVTTEVRLDSDRSSLRLIGECPRCGHRRFEVDGIAHRRNIFDRLRGGYRSELVPRETGKGLFVSKRQLSGALMFRVEEFPAGKFCTDVLKEKIQNEGLTNVSFLEVGCAY